MAALPSQAHANYGTWSIDFCTLNRLFLIYGKKELRKIILLQHDIINIKSLHSNFLSFKNILGTIITITSIVQFELSPKMQTKSWPRNAHSAHLSLTGVFFVI